MEEERATLELSGLRSKSEAWNKALERVGVIDYVPSSFTVCLRRLIGEPPGQEGAKNVLDEETEFLLNRFLRSPSIMAHVYFFTLTFHPDFVANHSSISARDFIKLYGAAEWAAVLALVFLTRTLKRKCAEQEWQELSKTLQEGVDIGGILGRRVAALGLGSGLLVPGVRYLALSLYEASDREKLKDYRFRLTKEKHGFDLALEQELWGCTHVQIAALLLLLMGFPSWYVRRFETALSAPPAAKLSPDINRLRILAYWSYALQMGLNPPTIAGEDDFITSDVELDQIVLETKEVVQKGSKHSWLLKTSNDLNPAQAAQVEGFEEAKAMVKQRGKRSQALAAAKAAEEDCFTLEYAEIPEKMRRLFSKEEFRDLKSEIQSLLSGKS